MDVRSASGRFLGTGLYNPHSLIAVRLLEGRVESLEGYLSERLEAAIAMRERLGSNETALRLVHSEADGLPGVVLDRYGDYLSLQITTRAMEAHLPTLLDLLSERLSPRGIRVDRGVRARETEGLPVGEDQHVGEVPESLSIPFGEGELSFPFRQGQKTGLFLDQKDNMKALAPRIGGGRLLDAFSYVGGWSRAVTAANPRTRPIGVDGSGTAISFYRRNNPTGEGVDADFFSWGETARSAGRRFDTVVLDPPAFIKSRRLVKEGIEGYHKAFRLGLSLVGDGGVFVACSCSALLSWEDFFGVLRAVFRKDGRPGRLFYTGRASWDHPRILAMPELDYLKCAAFYVGDRTGP
uniref:RlmI-like PUA domain-containing protein n=1 Tax=Leptospirillum ferrodiazotrophum TaxID=412449 RepID=C6HW80_9BACT|nr:MAG: conserved protein of unknown function [Leptospirillum ferrodiazotrophum]